MKRYSILAATVGAALAMLLTMVYIPSLLEKEIVKKPSVFKIIHMTKDGQPAGSGTAFATHDSYGNVVFITNAHVCASKKKMWTWWRGQYYEHKVLKEKKDRDLCMLRAPHYATPLEVADEVVMGERVRALGFPWGLFPNISHGELKVEHDVTIPTDLPTKQCKEQGHRSIFTLFGPKCLMVIPMYATTTEGAPGNSGSPVLNEDGKIVGVISVMNNRGPAWLSAIMLRDLKEFLKVKKHE
mgnify:CR=1 FL=1